MDNKKSIFLMLGVLFLGVIMSLFLIFLESKIPVILILAFGVIYTIVINLILISNKRKRKQIIKRPQNTDSLNYFYNDMLKNSIELNEKVEKLNKREQNLKKIAENAKKTMKLANEIKKQVKPIKQVKYLKPKIKFVASINSNKFHDKHCKFSKLISSKNRLYFKTKSQALKQGFKPCENLLNGKSKK